jgi:hypothetical protein
LLRTAEWLEISGLAKEERYNRLFMDYFCNGEGWKSSNKWGEIWKSSRAAGAGRSRERGKIPESEIHFSHQ